MGFGPDQFDRWEPWQFAAAWRGWKLANVKPTGPKAPSDDEFRRAVERTMH